MQLQDIYYAQKTYAAFPQVFPSRLQHFEYESISFKCEGFEELPGWGVMRKIPNEKSTCGTNWGLLQGPSCIIRDVYVEDSGEYWCETGDEQKRNIINITCY
ncbi:hypothetical protein L3Q82_016487 [Scortum barcoo]|uniref:Uncharacterized protein n=1 Tax=Scortum barcoo TaxID=214431 RepID=A0ACB8X9K6_9TELE|nr:hypothetical protein L3Q82_016487 [Scortum barcoo]